VLFRGLSIEGFGQPEGDMVSAPGSYIGLNAKGILWCAFNFKIIFNAKHIYKDWVYFYKKTVYHYM